MLHNCTKERMLAIGKDFFGITGISRQNKDVVFQTIYNHMLTVAVCVQCEGQCQPQAHEFPPYTEKSPEKTPETSPERSPRPTNGQISPTSGLIRYDVTDDSLQGGSGASGSGQLFPGQPGYVAPTPAPNNLQLVIRNGAQAFSQSDRGAFAAEQARTKATLDKAEAEEDARRKRLLEEAAAEPTETNLDGMIAADRLQQQKDADARHAAKEQAFQKQLEEVRRQKRIAAAAPREPVVPPRGPSSLPPDAQSAGSGAAPSAGASAPLANGITESSDSSSIPIRNLVDYMTQSMISAMDLRDRSKSVSLPIGAADVNNPNAVPAHPNTGRIALRAVVNKEMCARLGLAPAPNMIVEGDPTNIDYTKVSKHMKSGSKRGIGEFVERQTTWPQQCLSPSAPTAGKPDHEKLSFPELIDGFIGKILTETPSGNLDTEVANKLSYLKELTAMHYTLDLSNVLAVNRRFLEGWENKNFEWSDWKRIELFLRESRFQQLVSSMSRGRESQLRGGNGRSNSAPPGPQKPAGHINGVGIQFFKDNNICMKYNKALNSCKETTNPHKHPHEANRMLYHVCAACKQAGKSGDGHGNHDPVCQNKQSFRG